ncbi:MAG TPA: hypothetical protein VMW19_02760 [Myxococcota bacterium]|nr:hypothetical protein [Myxococcota bacterium]
MKEPLSRLSSWLDAHAGSRPIVVLLLLLAAVLGDASARSQLQGIEPSIRSDDALEHAVMARRLARGEGFTTGVIYPAELRLGADSAHPAIGQPPLWPLVLAAPFAAFGADDGVARATTIACFAALVAVSAALAGVRGGLLAGAVAAIAVATTDESRLLALEPTSATLFGVAIALAFWLCTSGAPAFAVGLVCGLAYLTRYGGLLLLPAVLALVFARRRDARALGACAAGFAVVALPWWIRNTWVAGQPFASLQNLSLWAPSLAPAAGSGPLFETSPAGGSASELYVNLRTQLPGLVAHLPFASVNLAAFAGVLLGCVRLDAYCGWLAAIGIASLGLAALTHPTGAEFVPWIPAWIALGTAAWMRHGGWLRAPALALLLASPLLPTLPTPMRDLRTLLHTREFLRDPSTRESSAAREALRACVGAGARVIAQAAPRIAWQADAIAIYAPNASDAFWQIAEDQDVAFAQRTSPGEIDAARFAAEFEQRPGCPLDIYARRAATAAPASR